MSAPINDGGPAFPVADTVHPNGQIQYGVCGMSLRDWFAGQALSGLLADSTLRSTDKRFGEAAYSFADAMLAARAEKEDKQ